MCRKIDAFEMWRILETSYIDKITNGGGAQQSDGRFTFYEGQKKRRN